MNNIKAKFESFPENKLIDVVQNYRQYGYPEEYRKEALMILKDRGIDEETLKLRGQLENQTFNEANYSYRAFRTNSKIAFALYLSSFLFLLVVPFILPEFPSAIFALICSLGYLLFLILSFFNQTNFYKAIGKGHLAENPILFLLVGMPLYFLVYFYVKGKMRDQLKVIG